MSSQTDKAKTADLWRFPWPIMNVLIGGHSSIDLEELRVPSLEAATAWLRSYGYDPEKATDLMYMHAVIIEAITFIESTLVSPKEWQKGLRPPEEVSSCKDPRQLLVWASDHEPEHKWRQAWSCAVLRVMHTIAHIEGIAGKARLGLARIQIMDRFKRYIYTDKQGHLCLGDELQNVQLARLEWKHAKARNSIILKLLHKRDNVADAIYDYLGVRIVTKRVCDVMLVVKLLHRFNMVSYPNCYPARARNTLVDLPRFRARIETLRDMLLNGAIAAEEFEAMVSRIEADAINETNNPHSASSYRSIQLTGRQLIVEETDRLEWIAKLNRELDSRRLPATVGKILNELHYLVDGWYSVQEGKKGGTFFPFEVQIMDARSYEETVSGQAAHTLYKESQVKAARKRVLSAVLAERKLAAELP